MLPACALTVTAIENGRDGDGRQRVGAHQRAVGRAAVPASRTGPACSGTRSALVGAEGEGLHVRRLVGDADALPAPAAGRSRAPSRRDGGRGAMSVIACHRRDLAQATLRSAGRSPSARRGSMKLAYHSTNWITPPSCSSRIGAGLIGRRVDAEGVFLDDPAVLVVGLGPDMGQFVEVVVDAFDRILVHQPFGGDRRFRRR